MNKHYWTTARIAAAQTPTAPPVRTKEQMIRAVAALASPDNPVMARVVADLTARDEAFFATHSDMSAREMAVKVAKGEI